MFNTISGFTHQILPFVEEKIMIASIDRQKYFLISLVVAIALGCIAACYAVYSDPSLLSGSRVFAKKSGGVDDVDDVDDDLEDESDTPYTPFEEAMDLMFEDRGLRWGVWLTLDSDQLTERYKKLKSIIETLSSVDVNGATYYRDGMMTRTQTLLLQAIMCIQDRTRRLEIIKMLLDKGADPHGEGFYYTPVDLLAEAKATGDERLIELIENARYEFSLGRAH